MSNPEDERRERKRKSAYMASSRGKQSRQRYRSSPRGKATARRLALKRYYGITPEEWDIMLAKQGGTCALCSRTARLEVDHDHATGRFRGLLCKPHNAALGHLGDTFDAITRALEYVR